MNHILCSIVGQTVEKIFSQMADGGHFGFGAFAHIFARGMARMGIKFYLTVTDDKSS